MAHNEGAKIYLEQIGAKFLDGYHQAILNSNSKKNSEEAKDIPEKFQGFYYEGAAMACSILDGISLFRKNRFESLINHPAGNKHIYMLHVGAGWAFARLPVSIEKKIQQYDPVLRWLMVDGYGFHQAYFKTKKYVLQMQLPRQLKEPYSLKAFYQGVGRCLWFVDCAVPEKVAERITGFPGKYHGDLWSGVGLAAAYAGGICEDELVQLKKLSGFFSQHLSQGAVFAAKARERAGIITPYNQLACKIICGITVDEAASIADRYYAQIPENLSSSEKYEWWRQSIRNVFIKTKNYEPIAEEITG